MAQADWPEFRGPWGDGHVSAPGDTKPIGLPLHWSETNNVKWKTEIPYPRLVHARRDGRSGLADHRDLGGP